MVEPDPEKRFILSDCEKLPFQDNTFDLVFCSPPYENRRSYKIGFNKKGKEYVAWAFKCYKECLRVSKGLVAWVMDGQTSKFKYSAVPMHLMVQLDTAGYHLRRPPIYQKHGIPGSGGPDWLRNDYQIIVCATEKGGKLPWSDPIAMGTVPKTKQHGRRVGNRKKDGTRTHARFSQMGPTNPGNVIVSAATGGNIDHPLCHENEAPFPEYLAEFFIRSFCPRGGCVLDPFCGSGTTIAVAHRHGRIGTGCDIRQSQIDLSQKRFESARKKTGRGRQGVGTGTARMGSKPSKRHILTPAGKLKKWFKNDILADFRTDEGIDLDGLKARLEKDGYDSDVIERAIELAGQKPKLPKAKKQWDLSHLVDKDSDKEPKLQAPTISGDPEKNAAGRVDRVTGKLPKNSNLSREDVKDLLDDGMSEEDIINWAERHSTHHGDVSEHDHPTTEEYVPASKSTYTSE
jgi:hypothetical protein